MKEWLNFLNKLKNYTPKESKPKLKPIRPFPTSSTKQGTILKNTSHMVPFSWTSTINKKLMLIIQPYSDLFNKPRKVFAISNVTAKKVVWTHAKHFLSGQPYMDLTISKEYTNMLTLQQWPKKNNDPRITWSYKLRITY